MAVKLVTGGAGFIGSHLAERLVELGHDVRIFDNFSTGRRENISHLDGRAEIIEADIRSEDAMRAATAGVDTVFHLAALASVPRSVDDPVASNDVNVRGSLNVLVASRDAGVRRLVYASSSSVYGDTPELPKREDMPARPMSPYAVGKLAGEYYARIFFQLYGLETVCLRYFNVFGPRQDPSSQYAAVVPIFTSKLLVGEAPIIYGDGEQSRDFTYVSSIVSANILASERSGAEGLVFNVAHGDTVTVNELYSRLQKLTASSKEPRYEASRPGDVKHSYADISQARSVLEFVPIVGFDEGLALTVEWFRSQA
ncbi:SDR family oxidoreductase [bacterium]|nr:SDR family oxidoreductase [bacterium]